MNLFFLDIDPKQCAIYHCDKHVVKMILELVQLMYTAHNVNPNDKLPEDSYRSFNPSHPTGVWVRMCVENYTYTSQLAICLCEEYTHRYNKIHACEKHARWLINHLPLFKNEENPYQFSKKVVKLSYNKTFEKLGMTPVPLAMPEDCFKTDTIKSYRNYYLKYKVSFVKWKKRKTPWWFVYLTFERLKQNFNNHHLQFH